MIFWFAVLLTAAVFTLAGCGSAEGDPTTPSSGGEDWYWELMEDSLSTEGYTKGWPASQLSSGFPVALQNPGVDTYYLVDGEDLAIVVRGGESVFNNFVSQINGDPRWNNIPQGTTSTSAAWEGSDSNAIGMAISNGGVPVIAIDINMGGDDPQNPPDDDENNGTPTNANPGPGTSIMAILQRSYAMNVGPFLTYAAAQSTACREFLISSNTISWDLEFYDGNDDLSLPEGVKDTGTITGITTNGGGSWSRGEGYLTGNWTYIYSGGTKIGAAFILNTPGTSTPFRITIKIGRLNFIDGWANATNATYGTDISVSNASQTVESFKVDEYEIP
jgi:hypothetical protein